MQPSIGAISICCDKSRIAVRSPPLLVVGCLVSEEHQGVIRILVHAVIVPRREKNQTARKVLRRVGFGTNAEGPEINGSSVRKSVPKGRPIRFRRGAGVDAGTVPKFSQIPQRSCLGPGPFQLHESTWLVCRLC